MRFSSTALLAFFFTAASARLEATTREDVDRRVQDKGFGDGTEPTGRECCQHDYECGPKCFIPYGQTHGFCVNDDPPSPTPPAPTPAHEPTVPQPTAEPCPCDVPKTIPDKCEVLLLIGMLDAAVSGDHKLAAQWLRGSFHDAGTFNQGIPEGGANGCLMNEPDFLNVALAPENAFLDVPVDTLRTIKINWINDPATCIDVSSADVIQFAGLFATVRQRGPTPGVMDATKEAQLLAFEWGRPDEANCDHAWTNNLPGFSAGIGQLIPMRCAMSGQEIKNKMMDRNGFSAEEATALIGAHTIGLVRNTFGAGLAGAWVPNGEDAATPDGPVFDNAFHHFLVNNVVENDAAAFAGNTAPFDQIFPDWFRVRPFPTNPTPFERLDHLDTDVALAFPPAHPGTNPHPDYSVHTVAFAGSNGHFLTTFDAAYDKMSKLGVTVPLSPPGECCDDGSSGGGGAGGGGDGEVKKIPLNATGVLKLVGDLGTAKAYADAKIRDKQDDPRIAENREVQTEVVQEMDCDEGQQFCRPTEGGGQK